VTATGQGVAGRRGPSARDRLYEAAATLFVERGFQDTTMAEIAERAGTSRRTAFNHFPSKGDIPMLWARRMADRAVEAITDSRGDDAPERISRYFRLISQMVAAEPELTRQMMLGWTAAVGPIRYESQFLTDLTPLLRDGQASGQVDPAVDVAEAARTLADVYLGVIFRWVRDQDTARTLEAVADGGIRLVLSAIRPHT
jgi:AcrR family transcriptional regulator